MKQGERKGQDKGKGHGKGKGKGPDKGKGKGAPGKGYQGTCWNCGKVGHKSAECWVDTRSTAAVSEADAEEYDGEACEERRCVDSVWTIANVEEADGSAGTGRTSGRRAASRSVTRGGRRRPEGRWTWKGAPRKGRRGAGNEFDSTQKLK